MYLFLIKRQASTEITSSRSVPILNTRDVRASRFESSASNVTETNILKGPFVIFRVLPVLVVALRAYSLHKCILMKNSLPPTTCKAIIEAIASGFAKC